jgi:pSer/pThr/pTyr-binding forkhead associated (FHA) protein
MEKNEISIGRSRVNDLVVPHKEVSSFHCKLVFHTDGSLWIHDMDSTNGVFVNGIRIRAKHRVMPGDLIRLGSYDLDWQQALLAGNDAEPAKEKMQPSPMVESGKTQSSPALKWAVIASVFVGLLIVFFNTGLFEKSKEIIAEVTQTWQLKNKDIVYDISCLVDETQGGKLIKVIGDTKKELMGVDSVKIDIKEEEEVGLAVKKQIDKEYKYSNDPEYTDRINRIFSKLRSKMDKSKFKYEIHVVESETINALDRKSVV